MKTWKIFREVKNETLAYVNINEKDQRKKTSYYSLQFVRKYFNDYSINGVRLLKKNEKKESNIPIFELYYPEKFVFNGVEYILEKMDCTSWPNEACGFCRRADGLKGRYFVDFNNKQDLLPIFVGLV